jgi:hypothetical protein
LLTLTQLRKRRWVAKAGARSRKDAFHHLLNSLIPHSTLD